MTQSAGNRWRFVIAALVMQLCLGALYSWSVFRGPLETLYGWSKETSIAPFRYSLLFFTLAMVVAGFWQDKKGPRLVGSIGGALLGTGCLLAALMGHTPPGLNFAYGILGGLGIGFAYVTPIATCVKWFPDKRGMVVGLAVMGFGAGLAHLCSAAGVSDRRRSGAVCRVDPPNVPGNGGCLLHLRHRRRPALPDPAAGLEAGGLGSARRRRRRRQAGLRAQGNAAHLAVLRPVGPLCFGRLGGPCRHRASLAADSRDCGRGGAAQRRRRLGRDVVLQRPRAPFLGRAFRQDRPETPPR